MKTIVEYRVVRGLLGGKSVSYACPRCSDALKSPLEEAGQEDRCPTCDAGFIVPGEPEKVAEEAEAIAKAEREAAYKESLRREREHEQAVAAEKAKHNRERTTAISPINPGTKTPTVPSNLLVYEVEGSVAARDAGKSVLRKPPRKGYGDTLTPCEHCGHPIWIGADCCPNCNGEVSLPPPPPPDFTALYGCLAVLAFPFILIFLAMIF